MKSGRHGIVDDWFSNRCMDAPFSTSTVVDPDSDAGGWAPFDPLPLVESLHFVWRAQRGPDRRLSVTRFLDRGTEDGPQPLRNIRGQVAARFRITPATAVPIDVPSSERRREVQVGL
jgi:hypothetical protein